MIMINVYMCEGQGEIGNGFTCAINKTKVSIPHQEWREYMWGMFLASWYWNTATIPQRQIQH